MSGILGATMSNSSQNRFHFTDRTLDTDMRELHVGDAVREIEPKVFDLIEYLLRHRDRVVSKNELQEALWPGVIVTEAALSRSIMKARKALDDDAHEPHIIRTVPRKGFRFIAKVHKPAGSVFLVDGLSDVHFIRNGDVHIAWRTIGAGRPDILFAPGFVSHLDMRYRIQQVADFDAKLARGRRLITFDKRGVGLSDRIGQAPTLDDTVGDMRAVLDAADSQRVIIFAVSESGPAACQFAAQYPERVAALILYGTFAKGLKSEDYPYMASRKAYDTWLTHLIDNWGGPASLELFTPSHADNPEYRDGWARYLRAAATPASVKGILEVARDIDVRDILPNISCPTLVLHRTGDKLVDWRAGRDMAAAIPNGKFVALDGVDHWWFVGDSQSVLDAAQPYLEA
jgi:pimeloyl-ACP methyl ester carboxylesterase/DNA-binding winged helix-turn-helix (wHTH) protein